VQSTISCNTQSSALEDGQNNCPKYVALIGIINKPLLLHLVGCLYYLYQCCTVNHISYNEIYLLIKYIKSVLWRVAKRLSYIEDARYLKVNHYETSPFPSQIYLCVRYASNSNLKILERFQSKLLRIITDAHWYVPNAVIKRDLQVLTVRQEVPNYSVTYRQRLDDHPNSMVKTLFQRTTCKREA